MKFINKEDLQKKITINLDRKEYLKFIKDITPLCQKAEFSSNPKNLKYIVVLNSVRVPYMPTGGWSNRCEDFKFCLFLDWDNSLWWQVKTQMEFLQERFNLPLMYCFETESNIDCNGEEYGNYNVFCPIKLRFFETFQIQNETTCDIAHKNLPMQYRFKSAILRNVGKGAKGAPKFKCIVGDIDKKYSQPVSSAHLNFIHAAYPEIPKIKYTNEDGLKTLWLSNYKTASK